ncbi:hypothetical protein KEM09_18930 [Carboxylicivirga mesophila]|uniref:Uncharacterized protein n=1 Tax=Carboxylicivirga mesophila TaxID=1166478 RepID=A0ABS5KF30_9BACT|nr:hypothetical protein [Carboxylicivirga mesophila]MBS2213492.1 hypothetical protein [Carboxylicivirga mesophila]
MKKVKLFFLLICSSLFCYGQYTYQADSLKQETQVSLDLKLNYTPIQLDINSGEITKHNRPIYLYKQWGMYEQFQVTQNSTVMLMPYKAHYPADFFSYTGTNRIRDSFNPHGSNDIGSALINGFLNGVILGNKY